MWSTYAEKILLFFLDCYFAFYEVTIETENGRYANGNDIRLVNTGPIGLFSNFILTTSSEKHLEDLSQAHIVF